MNYTQVLRRTWHYVWNHRPLWLFGALLALTTVNGIYFWADDASQEKTRWDVTVQLTEDATIRLPGEGLRLDFTTPDGVSLLVRDGNTWREISGAWASLTEDISFDIEAVLILIGFELLLLMLLGLTLRYTSEASLIRMVESAERSGEKPGLRQGLRLGWTRTAWRLLLIDLVIHIPVTVAILFVFLVAFSPLLLWASGSTAAGVAGSVISAGLLFLSILLVILVNVVLSMVTQLFRRACAVEQIGVVAAIRQGWALAASHPKQVFSTWLIWIGIRLAWMFASVPVIIVLFPLLLLAIVAGAIAGGVPGALAGSFASLFFADMEPLILGGAIGLPIFILVMISPMLFVGGLVEVVKSSLWTLSYRELRSLETTGLQPSVRPAIAKG